MVLLILPQSTRGKSPSVPSPTCKLHGEVVTVSFPPFLCFPTIRSFFSQHIIQLKVLFGQPHRPSLLSQYKEMDREQSLMKPSPSATCIQNATTVSFEILFIFPHHSIFCHRLFSSYIVIQFAAQADLCQSTKGKRALHHCLLM